MDDPQNPLIVSDASLCYTYGQASTCLHGLKSLCWAAFFLVLPPSSTACSRRCGLNAKGEDP